MLSWDNKADSLPSTCFLAGQGSLLVGVTQIYLQGIWALLSPIYVLLLASSTGF